MSDAENLPTNRELFKPLVKEVSGVVDQPCSQGCPKPGFDRKGAAESRQGPAPRLRQCTWRTCRPALEAALLSSVPSDVSMERSPGAAELLDPVLMHYNMDMSYHWPLSVMIVICLCQRKDIEIIVLR